LGNAQDEAKEKVLHLRYQYDQKLANEKIKQKELL